MKYILRETVITNILLQKKRKGKRKKKISITLVWTEAINEAMPLYFFPMELTLQYITRLRIEIFFLAPLLARKENK